MSNRLVRVRELLRRELGTILGRDFEVAENSLVTVTDVDVTPDLRQAFVFVSIVGPAKRGEVLRRLEEQRAAIQRALYRRVVLKYSPTLSFRFDDSIERGNRVIDAIAEVDLLPTAEEVEAEFADGYDESEEE